MMSRTVVVLSCCLAACNAFQSRSIRRRESFVLPLALRQWRCESQQRGQSGRDDDNNDVLDDGANSVGDRRQFIQDSGLRFATFGLVITLQQQAQMQSANAGEFTPGGTLVDRAVGVTVGNDQASPSRKVDNSNVLFQLDYYFKFGTAAQWIAPDSTEFPTTMPFVRSQQRYDALKKYGDRIARGLAEIAALKDKTQSEIADPVAADIYQLRPMGLLANNFLASENTGTTNELFLARWYINEMYLLINDMRNAPSRTKAADEIYPALCKAVNLYLTLMNRVITAKVGDKFLYL